MIAVTPNTEAILKILDPIKFPKEIAFSPFIAAITEAANSGTLVPIAIMVIEITPSLTPMLSAMSFAPSTKKPAP